ESSLGKMGVQEILAGKSGVSLLGTGWGLGELPGEDGCTGDFGGKIRCEFVRHMVGFGYCTQMVPGVLKLVTRL
nr:hypothetical protein [Tanacetum cinerariifolium]